MSITPSFVPSELYSQLLNNTSVRNFLKERFPLVNSLEQQLSDFSLLLESVDVRKPREQEGGMLFLDYTTIHLHTQQLVDTVERIVGAVAQEFENYCVVSNMYMDVRMNSKKYTFKAKHDPIVLSLLVQVVSSPLA